MQLPICSSIIRFYSTTRKSKLLCLWLNTCQLCTQSPPWQSPRSSCHGAQDFWWIIPCLQFRPQKHIVWAATYPQCLSCCCGQCFAICQQTRSLRTAQWARCSTSAVSRSACDGSSCSCTSIHPPWTTQGTASATSEKKAWRLIFPPSCKRCGYVPWNSFSFPCCPSHSVLLSWRGRLLNFKTHRPPCNWLSKRILSIFVSHKAIQLKFSILP